ncbi:hypothetical protein ACFV2C_08495 [[Kitasatospora] papulosa]|uniref:hypothetical protein n=1 Tax=[Kitasatospora] papulosa TaxID=1464011 RepID=UPI0036A339F6
MTTRTKTRAPGLMPLINNASGPLFYFGMVFSKYQHAAQFAAERARTLGLVCFDPQDGRLVA